MNFDQSILPKVKNVMFNQDQSEVVFELDNVQYSMNERCVVKTRYTIAGFSNLATFKELFRKAMGGH